MKTYYRAIHVDAPHSDEHKIIELCNKKNISYYVYAKEIGKKTKKEHWHIVTKGSRDPSTITKDIKEIFNINKTSKETYSNKEARDLIKAIAYCIKDGQYNIHWDNNEQIDEAMGIVRNFKEEEHLPTLRDKILFRVNQHPDSLQWFFNTQVMTEILVIFKEKKLSYPSQSWMKQCIVTYWMQDMSRTLAMDNIEKIYNINNPFIKDNEMI